MQKNAGTAHAELRHRMSRTYRHTSLSLSLDCDPLVNHKADLVLTSLKGKKEKRKEWRRRRKAAECYLLTLLLALYTQEHAC